VGGVENIQMAYFLPFGAGLIALHTISILFVSRISLIKRLFLVVWVMLFAIGAPFLFQQVPGIAFVGLCALALAVADKVWMLENSMYAVLSPEGFASILWKDGSRAMEAAELMKITSHELLQMEVVDKVIPERGFNNHELLAAVKEEIATELNSLSQLPLEQLLENRYQRFRKY